MLLDVRQRSGEFLSQIVVLFFLHLQDVVEAVYLRLQQEVAAAHRLSGEIKIQCYKYNLKIIFLKAARP
jgi:hypothetical protein